MKIADLNKYKLPNSPGVYFFKSGNNILYIGKATNLKDRVKSYFSKDIIDSRGPLILDMVFKADKIDWQTADSVLEALILESNLIKKYKPKYNTKEKDNKSWNYVCITRDSLPKVLVVRGRNIDKSQGSFFGPFTNGLQLREALKIVRKIFPYVDVSSSKKQNFEFYRQLGLTPAILQADSLRIYKQNISNLKLFFQGKKRKIILNLKKEMLALAKDREFEKASGIKKKIFALQHINDIALIKEDILGGLASKYRIEAYDIAHMSGKNMVGVMTVISNSEPVKSEYKKFIIRNQTVVNDTRALEEVLTRRFKHTEWALPALIVVDGSMAQMNIAKKVLKIYKLNISIVAVVKDDRHKVRAIIGDDNLIKNYKKSIILANSEAHRFAILYHKQKRAKMFL